MSFTIVNILLGCSLALLIYSWCKRRNATLYLLKVMLISGFIIMMPVVADEGDIGLTGVWGIPEPTSGFDAGDIPGSEGGPIIVPLSEALNSLGDASIEADSWTAGAYAFLRGNETLINTSINNTNLVIA